jgi:MFS family permease
MRPKFFYGYVILALCFVNMVVMRGVTGSFSVYYLPLLENFSWSHSEGASIASVNFLIYALAAPFVGLAYDRFGPRILMPLGGALVGAGLLLSGFTNSLWHMYFSFGLVTAVGQGPLGFVGHNALISFWFVRRRATAIGIASMGQGLGALIMVPLTQFLIDRLGWRLSFIVTSGLIFLAIVPANALLQRRAPQDVGQFPDGDATFASEFSGRPGAKSSVQRDWTLRAAIFSLPFWYITVGHLALGTAVFMINTHIVAHLVAMEFDKLAAAFVAGLIGFVRIGGTVVWGHVSDKLSRDGAYAIATLVTLAGLAYLIALSPGSAMWSVYLGAVLYSIGHSAGNPTYGSVIADIFSGRKIGLILGFIEISFGLGSALGAWIGGYLFDLTGSYRWPFSLCLLCYAISALAIHACSKWQSQHARETSESTAAVAG